MLIAKSAYLFTLSFIGEALRHPFRRRYGDKELGSPIPRPGIPEIRQLFKLRIAVGKLSTTSVRTLKGSLLQRAEELVKVNQRRPYMGEEDG